ncbi:translation initiation factor IF-3, mitochondrial [Drosophila eugracilis]|uniref:translation initiation factor IF-3, mitochondrial n=1 Tax=Drosophila eugracilis TaxID=29029 RepID=UPI0007E6E139|nr:translation initiation factor IF-3, mitochondrial [Drosophila eugracilis]
MQCLRCLIKYAGAAVVQRQPLRPLSIQWNLAQNQKPVVGNPGVPKNKDTRSSKTGAQKITLIQQNESHSITTLEEAQKLAKRRELHLLRLEQTDTGRPMFKLVTNAEILSDEADQSKFTSEKTKDKKSEKSLTIGTRITDHDLSSRLKNIVKWLAKRHEVRILIQGSPSGSDESSTERIVKAIEQTIKEPQLIGRIVQKRSKSTFIKFSIIPVAAQPVVTANPNTAQS